MSSQGNAQKMTHQQLLGQVAVAYASRPFKFLEVVAALKAAGGNSSRGKSGELELLMFADLGLLRLLHDQHRLPRPNVESVLESAWALKWPELDPARFAFVGDFAKEFLRLANEDLERKKAAVLAGNRSKVDATRRQPPRVRMRPDFASAMPIPASASSSSNWLMCHSSNSASPWLITASLPSQRFCPPCTFIELVPPRPRQLCMVRYSTKSLVVSDSSALKGLPPLPAEKRKVFLELHTADEPLLDCSEALEETLYACLYHYGSYDSIVVSLCQQFGLRPLVIRRTVGELYEARYAHETFDCSTNPHNLRDTKNPYLLADTYVSLVCPICARFGCNLHTAKYATKRDRREPLSQEIDKALSENTDWPSSEVALAKLCNSVTRDPATIEGILRGFDGKRARDLWDRATVSSFNLFFSLRRLTS